MFTIDPELCKVIKELPQLVKAERVTIEAKDNKVSFHAVNISTLTQFFHCIPAKVEKPVVFAVEVARIIHLLNRKESIKFSLEGSRLDYKSGRAKGSLETFTADVLPMDEIKSDKSLTGIIRDHFRELAIKAVVDGTALTLSIEEGPRTKICVVDSGAYHAAVVIKNTPKAKENTLSLPLTQIQSAMRVFKEDIRTSMDSEYFYCFNSEKNTVVRFRNTTISPAIPPEMVDEIVGSKNALSFKADAGIFDTILNDYKAAQDKQRGGKIKAVVEDGKITMSCETRHGNNEDSSAIKIKNKDRFSFNISISLINDLLRMKGEVVFSVKRDLNVMSIYKLDKDADLYYLCTIDKGEGFAKDTGATIEP